MKVGDLDVSGGCDGVVRVRCVGGVEGPSGMRRVVGGQGVGGRGVEGWSIEPADDRIAAYAVDCVPRADAWAASGSFG